MACCRATASLATDNLQQNSQVEPPVMMFITCWRQNNKATPHQPHAISTLFFLVFLRHDNQSVEYFLVGLFLIVIINITYELVLRTWARKNHFIYYINQILDKNTYLKREKQIFFLQLHIFLMEESREIYNIYEYFQFYQRNISNNFFLL